MEGRTEWQEITAKKKYTADVILGVDFDYLGSSEYTPKHLVENLEKLVSSELIKDVENEEVSDAYELLALINQDPMYDTRIYVSSLDIFSEHLLISYYSYFRNPLVLNFNKLYKIKKKDTYLYGLVIDFISKVTSTHSIEMSDDIKVTKSFKESYYSFDKEPTDIYELIDSLNNLPDTPFITSMLDVLKEIEEHSLGYQGAYTYAMSSSSTDANANEEIESYFEEAYEVSETIRFDSFEDMTISVEKYADLVIKFEQELESWGNKKPSVLLDIIKEESI